MTLRLPIRRAKRGAKEGANGGRPQATPGDAPGNHAGQMAYQATLSDGPRRPATAARFAPRQSGLAFGLARAVRPGGAALGLQGQGWTLASIALATRRRRALDAGGAAPDNAGRSAPFAVTSLRR